jgi:poly(ribitol-phosphate) beta-N-acetylglucosaminyltransferase
MKYSIVIPTYNSQDTIEKALLNIVAQNSCDYEKEVVIVDDCSSDLTMNVLKGLKAKHHNIKVFNTTSTLGPGAARNIGLKESTGDWVLFLDSDDAYTDDAIESIHRLLNRGNSVTDILCFNWCYGQQSSSKIHGWIGRDDLSLLGSGIKQNILNAYLLNHIDGSAIYSVFRREFLLSHKLRFREGYHEDVDFMFTCFYFADKITTSSDVLYIKNNRAGSIVNTISTNHLEGYFGSLRAIYNLIKKENLRSLYVSSFMTGAVNITASRISRICRHNMDEKNMFVLLQTLYKLAGDVVDYVGEKSSMEWLPEFKTKYQRIYRCFNDFMVNGKQNEAMKFKEKVIDIDRQSWSCYDLQNSVFLAPDEIRTCCKRFFFENKMKGDVVLLRREGVGSQVTFEDIFNAKKSLHREINRDNYDGCKGCPHLKFDAWDKVLAQGVRYLSFEYHSICNMRCNYCSELYYGGKKPEYDVDALVDEMIKHKALTHCDYIVWGGGEPTIDKLFEKKLIKISNVIPNIKQRIITNATKFSLSISQLLSDDKVFVVTSVDAGTQKTFENIRGYKNLSRVMSNLQSYAKTAPRNIVVKYILLPGNDYFEELVAFINLIKEYNLTPCNFQVSCDFKKKVLSYSDILAISQLYGLLRSADVRYVFIDDLIWQRMPVIGDEMIIRLKGDLDKLGMFNVLANDDAGPKDIAVWGTGAQSELVVTKSNYFSKNRVFCYIDHRKIMAGKLFHNKKICDPTILRKNHLPVVIAAVQSSPHIYSQYLSLNLKSYNLVDGLII